MKTLLVLLRKNCSYFSHVWLTCALWQCWWLSAQFPQHASASFFQVLIEATVSRERRGYIAVDDIMVLNYPCCKCHLCQRPLQLQSCPGGGKKGRKIKTGADWRGRKVLKLKSRWELRTNDQSTFYMSTAARPWGSGYHGGTITTLRCPLEMPTLHLKTNCPPPFASGFALQPDVFVCAVRNWRLSLCCPVELLFPSVSSVRFASLWCFMEMLPAHGTCSCSPA